MVDQTSQELPELNLDEMAGRLRRVTADQQEQQFVLVAELYGDDVAAELRAKLAKLAAQAEAEAAKAAETKAGAAEAAEPDPELRAIRAFRKLRDRAPKAQPPQAAGDAEALAAGLAHQAQEKVRKFAPAKAFLDRVSPAILDRTGRVIVPDFGWPTEWSDLRERIPHGADELEALTYVPGVVGAITEWIVRASRRPNRMMALAVAIATVGTLISRRIKGPTGSATHVYVIMLAPTGYGKDAPLHCGGDLMDALGCADLLGPHELASSGGVWNQLKRNPVMICLIDELGDELNKLNQLNGNVWVKAILGTLKKSYNAWATVITAEKVHEESERIDWPAPSIVGAATPEAFFGALTDNDISGGFANRLMILPFEGSRRPAEVEPPPSANKVPPALVGALRKLPRQACLGQAILDRVPGTPAGLPQLTPVDWGPGAGEVYFAFSRKMDELEGTNKEHYHLSMRACENAVRFATDVAVGRFSPTVACEDIAWATALGQHSFEASCGGVERYMRRYFEFPQFCDRVLERIAANGGWRSRRDLERDFRRNERYGHELDRVFAKLIAEERIKSGERSGTRGPSAKGFILLDKGE